MDSLSLVDLSLLELADFDSSGSDHSFLTSLINAAIFKENQNKKCRGKTTTLVGFKNKSQDKNKKAVKHRFL